MNGTLDALDLVPSYHARVTVPLVAQDMATAALGYHFKIDRRLSKDSLFALESFLHWEYEANGSITDQEGHDHDVDQRLSMDGWQASQRTQAVSFALRANTLFGVPCAVSIEHPLDGAHEQGLYILSQTQDLHLQCWDSRQIIEPHVWATSLLQASTLDDLLRLKEESASNMQESSPLLSVEESQALLPPQALQLACVHGTLFVQFLKETRLFGREKSAQGKMEDLVKQWTQENALELWTDSLSIPMLDKIEFWSVMETPLSAVYGALPPSTAWACLCAEVKHWKKSNLKLSDASLSAEALLEKWDLLEQRLLSFIETHPTLALGSSELDALVQKMDSFSCQTVSPNAQREHRTLTLSQKLRELQQQAKAPDQPRPASISRVSLRL